MATAVLSNPADSPMMGVAGVAAAAGTTSGPPMSPQQLQYQKKKQNEIEQMKDNLSRYTRTNDRRMVFRSLKDVKALSFVQLEDWSSSFSSGAPPDIPTSELEKEVSKEIMKLNSIVFRPKWNSVVATSSSTTVPGFHTGPTIMLKGLLEELCDGATGTPGTAEPHVLYKQILARTARTTGSADAYFQLNSMLGSSDLMVMELPPSRSSSQILPASSSAIGGSKDDIDLKPIPPVTANVATTTGSSRKGDGDDENDEKFITMDLYKQNEQIHMTLDMSFDFGLFRKSDVKLHRPWIVLHAVVHERANLSTGKSVRSMKVRFSELY
mmetsp:Transcript_61479/g.150468  ORF Transcript_61479/g.150468 Transcript_61479/m.150468 type:complete len:325 (+) Transcript_61479:106-1080(+)